MTLSKKTVLGIVLLLLTVFAVYSYMTVFGARRREPEKAKLVIGRSVVEAKLPGGDV